MDINFRNKNYTIKFTKYIDNDNTALVLQGDEHNDYIVASTNIDQLPSNCIAVKNWSENEGVEDVLITNDIVKPYIVRILPAGYVSAPVYELSDTLVKLMEKQFEEESK